MPTCPSERWRLFHRGHGRRACPGARGPGVFGRSTSLARPPTSASTKPRLVSGSRPKGTVAKTRTRPSTPRRWCRGCRRSAGPPPPGCRWATARRRARSSESMVAPVTSSNLTPPSEHEPGVDVEPGPLFALGDGHAERAAAGEEREPDAAAGGGVPFLGGFPFQEHAADVAEAEDAELAREQPGEAAEGEAELGVAVKGRVAAEALRAQPALCCCGRRCRPPPGTGSRQRRACPRRAGPGWARGERRRESGRSRPRRGPSRTCCAHPRRRGKARRLRLEGRRASGIPRRLRRSMNRPARPPTWPKSSDPYGRTALMKPPLREGRGRVLHQGPMVKSACGPRSKIREGAKRYCCCFTLCTSVRAELDRLVAQAVEAQDLDSGGAGHDGGAGAGVLAAELAFVVHAGGGGAGGVAGAKRWWLA